MSKLNDRKNLYIKTGNWNRKELDSRQLLYMAADVTLPGTVVFDTLICLVLEIGVDYLDKVYTDLEEFVRPYVSNIEDRLWNDKLQHERYSIHPAERSLSTNVAALRLSVEIEVTENEAYEDVEDRRTNIMKQIEERGMLLSNRPNMTPRWLKSPEKRGDNHLKEIFEDEEKWE